MLGELSNHILDEGEVLDSVRKYLLSGNILAPWHEND